MKVATIFGTRPEIIRLSRVISRLDRFVEQTLVYTGQNYDPNLSDIFFEELQVRKPDVHWGIQAGSFPEQIAEMIRKSGEFFTEHRPDRVLILGDTNSGLAAVVAARMGIPVFHMEAGNRCYDDRVPEEINRRIIDSCSRVLMPYTHRSKENLLAEGYPRTRITVTGNPIWEVMKFHEAEIDASDALQQYGVEAGNYFVVTLHRAENVDRPERLARFFHAFDRLAETYRCPVVVSFHPRTRDKATKAGLAPQNPLVKLVDPLGFFGFVKLEKHAKAILTDSGTVQEEAALVHVPNVVVRDVTERAETIELGSGLVSGGDPDDILRCVAAAIDSGGRWQAPAEYLQENVSSVVTNVVLGHVEGLSAR